MDKISEFVKTWKFVFDSQDDDVFVEYLDELSQLINSVEKKLIDEIYNKLGDSVGDDVIEIAKDIRSE